MTKPSRETIRKRVATRRRNAAKRKRLAARRHNARLHGSMGPELAAMTRLEIDGCYSSEALLVGPRRKAGHMPRFIHSTSRLLFSLFQPGLE
jgi:hypothetical protein